jgi:hypothetical protein
MLSEERARARPSEVTRRVDVGPPVGIRDALELEQHLGEERFIRIHRSIIVNLERICGLELQASGEYEVVLRSKERLRLSRCYRKRFQERMGVTLGRG